MKSAETARGQRNRSKEKYNDNYRKLEEAQNNANEMIEELERLRKELQECEYVCKFH